MSNKAFIKQELVKNYRTGEERKQVSVSDGYGGGDIYLETFFDDEIELLSFILEEAPELPDIIRTILDFVFEHRKGISIDDVWYDWDDIKYVFQKEYGI